MFLAPTGAQGVTMSVRYAQVCLEREQLIFIFIGQRAFKEQSEHNNQCHTAGLKTESCLFDILYQP